MATEALSQNAYHVGVFLKWQSMLEQDLILAAALNDGRLGPNWSALLPAEKFTFLVVTPPSGP